MKVILTVIYTLVYASSLFAQKQAIKINSEKLTNLYQVSNNLYRCDQPNKKAMKELEVLGVKTVLNLRNRTNDKHEAKSTSLNIQRVAINAWKMDYHDILECLKIIQETEKPIAIHCLHGSDRTGVIVAAYRMVFEDWDKETAIREFLQPEFGFHAKWFPNLKQILLDLDIEQCKTDLAN